MTASTLERPPACQASSRTAQLRAALPAALAAGELSFLYQPQVDLRSGAVIGFEALMRWDSPLLGAVPPSEFVPIAEADGLMVGIGEALFRSACDQSVAWARAGVPAHRISVNFGARQLQQPDFSQRLQSIVLASGADPAHLGIEVAEAALMHDVDHARRALQELSAAGLEIALDNFGTGYSNLGVLRSFPFRVLKIDRSLIHDVTAAPEDVSITRAVLALAQGLKMRVLAEGVETEGQLKLLIAGGCELMQGFVFSAPLPSAEIARMLGDGWRLPERFLTGKARQRTLLIVDDEENVLSSLRRLLRGAGYQIVVARSGPEGLARLAEHDVDVIVSDQRMPGMTGVEFLRRAKELHPETVRIVLSGYTELQSITDAVNEGAIYKFLTKPWDDERLRAHVAEAFARKELSDENQRLTADLRTANLELASANERQRQALAEQREQIGLEESRELNVQDLLETLPTAVIGVGSDGIVAFVNRAARALMDEAPLLGQAAVEALPAAWEPSWRQPDGKPRRIEIAGRGYALSCAAHEGRGPARGQLLCIVPCFPERSLP